MVGAGLTSGSLLRNMKLTLATRTSVTLIERRILFVRGAKVLLDADLAELYGVPTKALNQAVSRNRQRFPADFMFQLTSKEAANLKSQSVTSSSEHGGRRKLPRCFTEQGVAMLSTVLRSRRAISVNIAIMRAFVHLRELLVTHKELALRIDELERRYDGKFAMIFDAIRQLVAAHDMPAHASRQIGFRTTRAVEPRQKSGQPFRAGRLK